MIQIQVNDTELDFDFSNIRTLDELLPSLKENYMTEKEHLVELLINGNIINPALDNNFNSLSLEKIQTINIRTSSVSSIVLDTIHSFPTYIDQLIEQINTAVKFYSLEKTDIGHAALSGVIETIDVFIQLITHIHKSLEVQSDKKLSSGNTIKQLEIHLLSVVKGILTAEKKNDTVMLMDLLEYELKDNLTQWKITAIPQIKRLNTL